jgi:hypothetical protein
MVERERDVIAANSQGEAGEKRTDFQEFDRVGQELYEEGYHQP